MGLTLHFILNVIISALSAKVTGVVSSAPQFTAAVQTFTAHCPLFSRTCFFRFSSDASTHNYSCAHQFRTLTLTLTPRPAQVSSSQLADLQTFRLHWRPQLLLPNAIAIAGGHSPLLIFVASLISQSIRRPRELVSTVNDLDRSSDVPLSEDDHDGMTFAYAGGTSSLYTCTST